MLRKLESMLICLTAVICFLFAGCPSLRTLETDDFADTKSRLVDMRQNDLDSLVSETPVAENKTKALLNDSGDNEFSLDPHSEPMVSDNATDDGRDQPEGSTFSQVSHSSGNSAVPSSDSNDMTGQSLKPLAGSVEIKSLPSLKQQGSSDRIIILKAKSNSLSKGSEIVENHGNPASFQTPKSTEGAVARGTSDQLSPINWVAAADAKELIPEVPAEVKPGQGIEKSTAVEPFEDLEVAEREPMTPLPVADFKEANESSLLQPVKTAPTESEGSPNVVDKPTGQEAESQFDPTNSTASKHVDLSHVATGTAEGETGALVPAVESVGLETSPRIASWDVQLKTTIDAFENQIIDLSLTDYRRPKLQQSLAILQVLDDRLSSGRIAIEQPRHRQYWQFQLTAILNMLQAAKTNKTGGQGNVSTAIDHLQSAVVELQQLSDLKIAKLEFCSEVSGYGQYEPMDSNDFRSGSQTLIYCEIENFTPIIETQKARDVFATRLECRLEILDQDDQVIQSVDFPVVQDIAVNHRRDFYMHLPLTLENLKSGSYTVKLDVKDLGSQKSATWSTVEALTVR